MVLTNRCKWLRVGDGALAVAERLLVLSVVLVLTLAVGTEKGLAADETLLLEVTINGTSTGKIGEFTLRDGALFARPAELADVGLRVPKSVPQTQDGLIALSLLEGVSAT